jgi:hypothetical protein
MKMVIIAPVVKPKSFEGLPFTGQQYADAVKAGEKLVPMVTALEAVRNSKGLYRIKPTAAEQAKAPRLPDPLEMSREAVFAELTMYGKAPQKQMAITKAREFLSELRAKSAEMIVDDEE